MAASAQKPVQGLFSSSLFTAGPGCPSKALRFWVGGLGEVGEAKAVRGCPEGCYVEAVARLSQRERERTPHTPTRPPVSGTIR